MKIGRYFSGLFAWTFVIILVLSTLYALPLLTKWDKYERAYKKRTMTFTVIDKLCTGAGYKVDACLYLICRGSDPIEIKGKAFEFNVSPTHYSITAVGDVVKFDKRFTSLEPTGQLTDIDDCDGAMTMFGIFGIMLICFGLFAVGLVPLQDWDGKLDWVLYALNVVILSLDIAFAVMTLGYS